MAERAQSGDPSGQTTGASQVHLPGTGSRWTAWKPLRVPMFRNLLIADLVSDIGTFMQGVGAAWLMVSQGAGPLLVALTQTASALPFFLLALPAGALGDIFDRRKLIVTTEVWMVSVATAIAALTLLHWITPWMLLLLTVALSIGDALEAPTWRAILPEVVPREDLLPAIALNGIEFNLARAIGPALGGFLIAPSGNTVVILDATTSNPPCAGPIARARLNSMPFRAMAGINPSCGTTSGRTARQVGASSASPIDNASVKRSNAQGVIKCRAVRTASTTATENIHISVVSISFRRSKMSPKAPAGNASRKNGNAETVCVSATSSGPAPCETISHAAPTLCINVPTSETRSATNRFRNTGRRSTRHVLHSGPTSLGCAWGTRMASVCISRRCSWSGMAALIYSTKGEKSVCSRLYFCDNVWAAGSVIGSFIVQFLFLTVSTHGLGGHRCRVA